MFGEVDSELTDCRGVEILRYKEDHLPVTSEMRNVNNGLIIFNLSGALSPPA